MIYIVWYHLCFYTHTHRDKHIRRMDSKLLTLVICRKRAWVMSKGRVIFMCERNVLPKTEIEANCVFSISKARRRQLLRGLRNGRAGGPLSAATPGWMGPLSGMKPCCLEHPINSPRSMCYPLLVRHMSWYLWLMSHVWWWFQIICATWPCSSPELT